jgi:dipeptidyl aminopeptidase/acylaminoacyl peptidase
MYRTIFALALVCAAPFSAAAESEIPVMDFVRNPTYSGVRISPNGEYLAMTVDRSGQDVLAVLRTKDLGIVHVNTLPNEKSVGAFQWVSPERLMFNSIKKFGRFAQPFGTGEWYSVNADGSSPRMLELAKKGSTEVPTYSRFSVLDNPQNDEGTILMTMSYPRSSEGSNTEVVEVNTLSGRWKSIARAPRANCSMALDQKKNPRYAICYDSEDAAGNYDSHNELYRRGDDGEWTLVNSSKSSGKMLSIFGTSEDGRIYATQSDGKAPEAFGLIDAQSGEFRSLFQDPVSEPSNYIVSADRDTVLAIVTEAGKPQITIIDEAHPDTAIYASLAAAFPDKFVNFSSATRDGKQIVVSVDSDRSPGELYLYDRDTGKARFLMQGRAWIDAKRMGSVKPIALTTRDGLKIHGYLTIPNGSDGKNLPMIVNVHGGPMGPRDNWGFNWESQLLASRGYLVLQINFRGSGGFGKAFQDMGFGTWATGIMDDIIDATKWTIAQGYADKDRVCIYGGSFGGYASMMAPAREQGVFKCAFGYVGAYDAEVQMTKSDTSEADSGRRYMLRALGKTKAERDAMSPVNHAAKINIPVYLAAGARDPRCPPENTEAMQKALIAAGNPPEGVMITSGEMHGFYKDENKLKLYTEMLNFFARHIGGKPAGTAQPAKSTASR